MYGTLLLLLFLGERIRRCRMGLRSSMLVSAAAIAVAASMVVAQHQKLQQQQQAGSGVAKGETHSLPATFDIYAAFCSTMVL